MRVDRSGSIAAYKNGNKLIGREKFHRHKDEQSGRIFGE
jgi:hypothetical protein